MLRFFALESSRPLNQRPAAARGHRPPLPGMHGAERATMSMRPSMAIDNTAVLIKYTYYGDIDFNGRVEGADYAALMWRSTTRLTQATSAAGSMATSTTTARSTAAITP